MVARVSQRTLLCDSNTYIYIYIYMKEKASFKCFFLTREERDKLPPGKSRHVLRRIVTEETQCPVVFRAHHYKLLLLTASTPASNLKAHYIKRGVTQRQKGKRLFQSLHSSDRNYEEESI